MSCHPFDFAQDRPERPQGAKDLLSTFANNGFMEILRPFAPQNDRFVEMSTQPKVLKTLGPDWSVPNIPMSAQDWHSTSSAMTRKRTPRYQTSTTPARMPMVDSHSMIWGE